MTTRITKAAMRSLNGSGRKVIEPPDFINAVAPSSPTPDEIRVWAYHKWASAGCPPGDGIYFWVEAERELSSAHGIETGRMGIFPCAES